MNRGFSYPHQVGPSDDGLPVETLLTARFSHSDRPTWLARIAAGEVEVDGRRADPEQAVRRGQRLVWHRPPWEEPAVPLRCSVLYADDDLLVVDKPSGLPTVPAGGFLDHTLLTVVQRQFPEATPMHRLGRGTSGIVLFARTGAARAALQADWRAHRVGKTYRALASGRVEGAQTIEVAIGPVAHPRLGEVFAASPQGRPARSRVRVVQARAEDSVVEVDIDTGRPHQIRIHLAAIGHPLVGDPLYAAGGMPRPEGLPGDEGYLLHAWRLRVRHPASGEDVWFEAEPPAELQLRAASSPESS